MKVFKVKIGDKQFIVKAQDKVDAVKKLKDAQNKKLCDETLEEKERKAQEWVDYDIKHYGKVSETTKEDIRKMGLDFDKWDNQVNDSAIKDSNFDTVKNVFNKYGVDIIKVVNRQDGSKAIYFDKKDKDIYNKPEIMDLYRSGKLRYAGSGYFVEVLDSSAIKDSNLSNAYAELKKYYPNAKVSMTNKTLIVSNVNELGSGIKNFLTNLNKKYGKPVSGFGGRPTNEPRITNNEALLFIDDSAIKDATPITVESVVYKEGDTVVLEYTYNGRKMWIVTSNYKGEKTYNGGGTIEFTKEAAIQTAKDFALIHRLQKKYGTTEGNKRYLAGYKDENPFEKGQAYYYAKTGNKVDINGEVFIINEDAGKIGYTNVIGLTNAKTGKHTQISKQDFIKEARLLKDSRLLKDARPDEDTISRIKKAAYNFRSNNISVAVITDADKDGIFIEEMYISTSGKWLETPQEADAYLRDLSNAVKFLKENYKYLGK